MSDERARAEQLVAANRLYRQTAVVDGRHRHRGFARRARTACWWISRPARSSSRRRISTTCVVESNRAACSSRFVWSLLTSGSGRKQSFRQRAQQRVITLEVRELEVSRHVEERSYEADPVDFIRCRSGDCRAGWRATSPADVPARIGPPVPLGPMSIGPGPDRIRSSRSRPIGPGPIGLGPIGPGPMGLDRLARADPSAWSPENEQDRERERPTASANRKNASSSGRRPSAIASVSSTKQGNNALYEGRWDRAVTYFTRLADLKGTRAGRGALLEVLRAEPPRPARRLARDDRGADQELSDQPLHQGSEGARSRGPRLDRQPVGARGAGRRRPEAHRDQRARPAATRRRPSRCSRNCSRERPRRG